MEKNRQNNLKFITEKYLPHNFLAEKSILCSLLLSSDSIEIALKTIIPEAFYFKNHQMLYKAIISMHNNKLPIDIVTLHSFLQDNGILEEIGGIKILIELINQIPNLVYFEDYIRLIKDKFLRRSLIKLGYEIINSAHITNIPLENIFKEVETKFLELTSTFEKQTISSTADLFLNIFLEIKNKSLNPSLSGLPSGFYDLDSFTQGFQKSDLIIIAGRPSMGKTAFALNIAINILKNSKLPVLIFSLEMSKEQLTYRLLTTETNINTMRLKSGTLYKEDWLKLNSVMKNLSTLPLFIDDSPNLTIQEIKLKINKIVFEQNKIGLIVIDYLQLMQNIKSKIENRAQELSQITRFLKVLAKEFQVPIIALSQLSRNVENRTNKRPILSDLRESGSIEQDADLVLMLYRDSYYNSIDNKSNSKNIVELIIAKHRNGPIGTVELEFDAKNTKFLNLIKES